MRALSAQRARTLRILVHKEIFVKKLVLLAAVAALATPAFAQTFRDQAEVVSVKERVERINRPTENCSTETVQPQIAPAPQEHSSTGAILGGLAGGILGHQVGQGSGQVVATVLGAVIGAGAGDHLDNRDSRDSGHSGGNGYGQP